MAITINGSGTITGASTLATTVVSPTLTTPIATTTIGVGNATPSASGAGVTFPATQSASSNANTLDDYEEGTFTLVVAPTSGSLTSYTSEGRYVKIGQAITIFGVFTLGTIGTASGGADLSGLPYASMSSALSSRTAIGVARENAATGGIYQVYVNSGLTTGAILTLTNNSITWTSGYSYLFTISYITAS